jgi:hypothetical protein
MSDADWKKTCPSEGWPAGVTAHHAGLHKLHTPHARAEASIALKRRFRRETGSPRPFSSGRPSTGPLHRRLPEELIEHLAGKVRYRELRPHQDRHASQRSLRTDRPLRGLCDDMLSVPSEGWAIEPGWAVNLQALRARKRRLCLALRALAWWDMRGRCDCPFQLGE